MEKSILFTDHFKQIIGLSFFFLKRLLDQNQREKIVMIGKRLNPLVYGSLELMLFYSNYTETLPLDEQLK